MGVTNCDGREYTTGGLWPKFELNTLESHLQQRCHMCYRRYEQCKCRATGYLRLYAAHSMHSTWVPADTPRQGG